MPDKKDEDLQFIDVSKKGTVSQTNAADIAKKYHQGAKKLDRKQLEKEFGYVKTPTEYQMEVSECGAASLSMILQHYGKYVPLEELRVETGVSRNGCNARHIADAAKHYGLEVTASARNLDRVLEKNNPPVIIHWNFSHFVVFEGFKRGKYVLNDPSDGRRFLDRHEMEEGYSGTVLECVPTENFRPSRSKRGILDFARERLSGQYSTLLILFLIGIAMILPGIMSPVFSQSFTDKVLVNRQHSWLKWLMLAMILSAFYSAYFTYLRSKISLLLETKMSLISTDNMIAHVLRLPLGFFEQRFAGDLVTRVYNNMAVSQFLANQLVGLLIGFVTSLVYLGIMLLYSVRLSLIGVGFSIFSVIAANITSKIIVPTVMKMGRDSGKMQGALYNGLSASASLKAVGAEEEYIARIFGYYAEVTYSDQKLGKMQVKLDAIPNTIGILNNVLILMFGSVYVIDGYLTPGMLMAFSGFLSSFTGPFSNIISFVKSTQQIKNDMARTSDIMNYKEEERYTTVKDESMIGRKLSGQIHMENVSFAYGKLDESLIRNFNLETEPGTIVALVGSSGCGKSTISKLLVGMYPLREGSVLYDEVEVERIPVSTMNSSVSVVTQSIALFDGTIFDNIASWNSSITRDDVINAAKDACIHDEITLKKGGYEYVLKENGSNLSGGQRQRIEIAKALATNPSILIMDEATSSLDTTVEKKIIDNIKKRRITTIMVAQRLSTIRDADEIILLERGRVMEKGTHEELMAKKGKYYKLVGQNG